MRVMTTGSFNSSEDLSNAINQIIENLEHEGKQVINIKPRNLYLFKRVFMLMSSTTL
ncbi:hypothetical protein [Borrelia sp. P9F1]|uniref:hypothetical protein n=1 Tax=Borrelia sp. P9F1 TaxID=3058374 RepID=UPI0026471C06|nr:hypothetical protein [Borrelia sp. P9F1]WKC58559.1 hypothetical protein QYZ68_05000 [Borrelia sp. P9F1]WKC58649.1 hypothetical protein QYZ68_05455 [Borrelia sp. P9F1]